MHMPKPIRLSILRRLRAYLLAAGLPACFSCFSCLSGLSACAGNADLARRAAAIPDLDSLNRVVEHDDSVESNYFFYEEAFTDYKARFPGVDKPAYMTVARGKDQSFCLFQPDPARTCLDVGEKFEALGLGEPARDAYEGGLLSEGVNGDRLNIRLWSGTARLLLGWGRAERAKPFLTKVLEVDERNDWARKTMAALTQDAPASEVVRKPARAGKTEPGQAGIKRGSKERPRRSGASRGGNYGASAPAVPVSTLRPG